MDTQVKPKNAPKSLFDPQIIKRAIGESFIKLDPRTVAKNPVMFVVEVGSVLTTFYWIRELVTHTGHPLFSGQVALWLWFTVLFANFAEAMAEGRGKAQADSLRKVAGNFSQSCQKEISKAVSAEMARTAKSITE